MADIKSIGGNLLAPTKASGALRIEIDNKADVDGYYEQLTAGSADNLTGRGDGVAAQYLYRTTGGDADVADGTATIRSVKGNTLAWNQLVTLTDGTTERSTVTFTLDDDGTVTASGTATGGAAYTSASYSLKGGHKYLIRGCPAGGSASTYQSYVTGTVLGGTPAYDRGDGAIFEPTADGTCYYIYAYLTSGESGTGLTWRPQLYDLTLMFGAGREPSLPSDFAELFPLPYYAYDAGTILPVQMEGVETVGFNAYDPESGTAGLLGGNQYQISGTYTSVSYLDVLGVTETLTIDAEGRFTPSESGTLTVTGGDDDTCVHLVWSGYRNGEYEEHWTSQRAIPAGTYFPSGMFGAGTAHDTLYPDRAETVMGSVDLGQQTWNCVADWGGSPVFSTEGIRATSAHPASAGTVGNVVCSKLAANSRNGLYASSTDGIAHNVDGNILVRLASAGTNTDTLKAALSGIKLYYELATPTSVAIDPPLNLSYKVSDFGTERVLVPTGETSAPPTMQVVYGLNAVDTIRRLPEQYISKESFEQYLLARDAHDGTTTTMTWDSTDNRYEFTITDNESEG